MVAQAAQYLTVSAGDDPRCVTADVLLAALDCASDGVLILDDDLHVRHVNAAAASIWGLDRVELIGSPVGRLGLEELERCLAAAIAAQASGADRARAELQELTIRHKDGSEILVHQGKGLRPRRLTPRECARLMGFPDTFRIPVSDTQAYRQFGNSVVMPVMQEVARIMAPHVEALLSGSGALDDTPQDVALVA